VATDRPLSERAAGAASRRSTGDPVLDAELVALLDDVGAGVQRGILLEILVSALRLAQADHDRLDLKITSAVIEEMRLAFALFQPFRDQPKVTIFGSARTRPEDPAYTAANRMAAALAERGWMVVTGAGPGIMAAAAEGAGRQHALGVNIRLPFEQAAHELFDDHSRLVTMKYFFTRKLMLIKESKGFVSLPGGFGTLDETFELLTLVQTGKADPVPIVLLDTPGNSYWARWEDFVLGDIGRRGFVSEDDATMWRRTDVVEEARDELLGFYRNHHSVRYVGNHLVLRMQRELGPELFARVAAAAAPLSVDGSLQRTRPLRPEVDDSDHLDLARVMLRYTPSHYGHLRPVIDLVNEG
jgi:uncharacterized protein (TIGR00730 family)